MTVVMVVVSFWFYRHHMVVMNMLHPVWNMDDNVPET